jgi:hypothetical protein
MKLISVRTIRSGGFGAAGCMMRTRASRRLGPVVCKSATLVQASKACEPRLFVHCETFRVTAA